MKSKKSVWAIVAVLVLCVLCGVGITVAKYVTSGNGEDSAQVAKFGVTVNVDASGVFSKEYTNADQKVVMSTNKVVAPGTNGSLAKIEITGTPEVNVEVAYKVTVDFGDNWVDADGEAYMPLVITVGSTEYKLGTTYTTIDALEEAISTEVTAQYPAGTTLENIENAVSWAWAFEGENEKDTYLANQTGDKAPTVKMTIEASVTQINTDV